jgi:hypothetical protein
MPDFTTFPKLNALISGNPPQNQGRERPLVSLVGWGKKKALAFKGHWLCRRQDSES